MAQFINKNPKANISEIIRVNHAGEYGAKRIYLGQLAVLKGNKEIEHMYHQELKHLEFFEGEITKRRIRPTILSPIWHYGGFMLGFLTAKMGINSAMACTEAVENVIEQHYDEQLSVIPVEEKILKDKIKCFLDEEIEHRQTAIFKGSKEAKLYPFTTLLIKYITKSAIRLSKKY